MLIENDPVCLLIESDMYVFLTTSHSSCIPVNVGKRPFSKQNWHWSWYILVKTSNKHHIPDQISQFLLSQQRKIYRKIPHCWQEPRVNNNGSTMDVAKLPAKFQLVFSLFSRTFRAICTARLELSDCDGHPGRNMGWKIIHKSMMFPWLRGFSTMTQLVG